MKTIRLDEILALYKACGLDVSSNQQQVRYQINTGSLEKQLNTGNIFSNQKNIITVSNVTDSIRKKNY